MSGQFKSQFKGQGVQFSEHRQYLPGDDIRHIDWKVSARAREPLVKKFEEERELTILLLVDVSGSTQFGSVERTKSDTIGELTGMLAYAASLSGDKVGAIYFGSGEPEVVRPAKGRKHVLRLIGQSIASAQRAQTPGPTAFKRALEQAGRVLKHRSVVFVISDFLGEGFELELTRLSRRHDVIALWVEDPRERIAPPVGPMVLVDAESGDERFVDTGAFRFKRWFEAALKERRARIERLFQQAQVECLRVFGEIPASDALVRFFALRARARRQPTRAIGRATLALWWMLTLASGAQALGGGIAAAWAQTSNEAAVAREAGPLDESAAPVPAPDAAAAKTALSGPSFELAREGESPLRVGDRVRLRVAGLPEGSAYRVDTGDAAAWVERGFEVLKSEGGALELLALKPGEHTLSELAVRDAQGAAVGRTLPLTLVVASAIAADDPTPDQPAATREPLAMAIPWVWVGIALVAVILLIVLSALLYQRWAGRRRPSAAIAKSAPVAIVRSPEEVALEALAKLAQQGGLERGEFKRVYFAISDIIKAYLSERMGIDGRESTSSELIAILEARVPRVEPALIDRVQALFEALDRVKFTDQRPDLSEAKVWLEQAGELVKRARPSDAPSAGAPGAAPTARSAGGPKVSGTGRAGGSRAL